MWNGSAREQTAEDIHLTPGPAIAHYTILTKLGEGGMGAVYRATDTKLNRDVAVKVLPDSFAADPDRLARFTREAQVLASLNHPNIATIYGVEERALVMELVEGDELRGPVPPDQALPVIHQLVDALEYAHEKGIVHRDLKPANIKVTPEGRVKVLDFGLAKAMSQNAATGDPQSSPTLTLSATLAGVIMGTAGYMAPEQARGYDADKRADIWAFGAVVYELVTGQQLFAGSTVSDSLAAVLTRDPDLDRVPAELRKLVRLCLVRDVKQRLRDIGDARIAIADGVAAGAPAVPAPPHSRLPWFLSAALAVGLLASLALWKLRPVEEARTVAFKLLAPDKSSFYDPMPAVSPDGRHIVFGVNVGGKGQLWIRDLETTAVRPLPGTEMANMPFWSPDSRSVGFFAQRKLKRIDISGGPASTICDAPAPRGGSWSARDVIVLNGGGNMAGLSRVAASGGTPATVSEPDSSRNEVGHYWPSFLPDGRHFLYMARSTDPEKTAIWLGDLDSKARRMVLLAASNAAYDPGGLILFLRGQTLMAQRFDAKRLETAGDAFPVAQPVDHALTSMLGSFSISQTGVLTYFTGGGQGDRQLTFFDRSGQFLRTVGPKATMSMPVISPDGSRVAVDILDEQTGYSHIWLHDLAHNTSSRLTFGPQSELYPSWSPDGSRLAYLAGRSGRIGLYMKPISGTGQEELLFDSSMAEGTSWSRDGKFVFVIRLTEKTGFDVWAVPNPLDAATRKPFAFLETAANERYGSELSPDGRYLAYSSNENGSYQVYVQNFPGKEGKFQISPDGGTRPVWSHDGKELFYKSPAGKLMAVDVKTGPRFEHGVPKALFDFAMPANNARFDVSPDGKRFLAPINVGDSGDTASLTVVLNWRAGVKK